MLPDALPGSAAAADADTILKGELIKWMISKTK